MNCIEDNMFYNQKPDMRNNYVWGEKAVNQSPGREHVDPKTFFGKMCNCLIRPKGTEDFLFYRKEVNGETMLFPNLDGYAIIPMEEYKELKPV